MLVLLYLFLIITNYLQQLIEGVNYFDEGFTILGIFIIFTYRKKVTEKSLTYAMRYIYVVLVIGTLSTISYHVQPQFSGIWRDALAISKFPICYYAYYLYSKKVNLQILLHKILPIAQICTILVFVLGGLTFVFKIPFLYEDERYGLPLFNMGFSHSTFLVATIFVLMSTLIAAGARKNIIYILMGIGGVLFTLRSKPMLPLVFLFIIWVLKLKKGEFKLTKKNVVLFSLLIFVLTYYAAYSQITSYVEAGEAAARGACYIYGADLANRYFPLGAGFCTFSSSLSGKYYSPLYYYYNLENMEGLTPDEYNYAADTFWPNIYSQYGWIGLWCYLFMLYYVMKSVHCRFKPLSNQWIAGMLLLVYCFAAAFAEAFLTNDTAVIYAITLALFLGKNHNRETSAISLKSNQTT